MNFIFALFHESFCNIFSVSNFSVIIQYCLYTVVVGHRKGSGFPGKVHARIYIQPLCLHILLKYVHKHVAKKVLHPPLDHSQIWGTEMYTAILFYYMRYVIIQAALQELHGIGWPLNTPNFTLNQRVEFFMAKFWSFNFLSEWFILQNVLFEVYDIGTSTVVFERFIVFSK